MVSDELWNEYFADRSEENRNKIVEGYIYYVKYLVNKAMSSVPEGLSKDDLEQAGNIGLMEAVERFNPINSNKFETYGKIRISGAISDYIRYYKKSNLGISRIKSTKIREIIQQKNILEQRLGRTPTKHEIAEVLNMSIREYEKILQDKEVKVFYEDDFLDKKNGNFNESDSDRGIENPEEMYMIKEERKLLKDKIMELNEVQQIVIQMYYQDECNFKEIGEELSLTESRISQIHRKAINRLKYLFDDKTNIKQRY